ncbi:MAG: amidohydrolase family protein [Bifidobacterium psychraerophilum]|uniref:amidohydrolase family protein n=1 Tax=Bifidobacterium psychraerophilum TaxID=218140 RepID=UPI0039E7773F
MARHSLEVIREHIDSMPLIDHHVHSCLAEKPSYARLEKLICESAGPLGEGQSRFDSQAGFSLLRHCSPLLFGSRCRIDEYVKLREHMPEAEIDARMLGDAGVSDWIIDPGWGGKELISLDEFSHRSQGRVRRLLRLESLAETVLANTAEAGGFPEAFRSELAVQSVGCVGFKSICAYRCGFDIDWQAPSDADVADAVMAMDAAARSHVQNPIITSFIIHEAMRYELPIQFHVGIGDRDVDLRHSNPLDLRSLLIEAERRGVPVALLHCWPFERECGYLCQNFTNVYMDVGLTMYLTGIQAVVSLRRAMELCPFSRLLYSSDAWGLPELHYLGAAVFREALCSLLCTWVESDSWLPDDALRVADMIASGNASRLYGLSTQDM